MYETPRIKRAPDARGGIGMFPTKASTFTPGSLRSKTPSARKQFQGRELHELRADELHKELREELREELRDGVLGV